MPAPPCAVCGSQPATYICQNCARPACSNCFDPSTWTCHQCGAKRAGQPPPVEYTQPLQFGLASLLFLVAFAAIFVGALLIAVGSMSNMGTASGGAVILIGPIPIILGGGPYSFELIVLSVALTIVAVVLFLFVRRRL